MHKFQCVNCVKHYPDEELFIRNQYCTGFCNLLHVMTVTGKKSAEGPEKEVVFTKKELQAA